MLFRSSPGVSVLRLFVCQVDLIGKRHLWEFFSLQNYFTIQSYSYIYYSSQLLVCSSSLGPLDLEFEAVLFFIWAWLYLQRESAKWAETLAQGVRGVNIK